MLHIPRYISSSRLRLSNFFIPFGRPYAGEVFDIKSSAGSLCVFPGERLKSAQTSTFLPRYSRLGKFTVTPCMEEYARVVTLKKFHLAHHFISVA